MSYTRPPFDAADASWSGVAVYIRPAHDAADATFMADAPRVEMAGLVVTTPPAHGVTASGSAAQTIPASGQAVADAPAHTATAAGTVELPIFAAHGAVQAPPPEPPPITASGAIHEFVPYVDPGLDLTLDCRLYTPRPLDCDVWLEYRQPPCLRVDLMTGLAVAPPPIHTVTAAGRAHGVQMAQAQITASALVPTITAVGTVQQALDLPDNAANGARAAYRSSGDPTAVRLSDRHSQAHPTRHRAQAPQQQAVPIQTGSSLPQTQMLKLQLASMLEHEHGIRLSGSSRLTQNEALRHREPIQVPQTEMLRSRSGTGIPHAEQIRTRTRRSISQQQAMQAAHLLQTIEQQGITTQTRLYTSQQQMMWPLPGRWWLCYEPPSLSLALYCDPEYIARPLSCMVLLCACGAPQPYCPGVDPEPTSIIIPIRRVYRVQNAVSLVRVSDGHPIEAGRLSLSLSTDAWTWSWSATMPATMLDLIRTSTDPEELLATINGESIRLRIDSISRARSFGSASLSVSGRGRAAVLASPTAPTLNFSNSETRTAQQLLLDALMDNGVPIGWDVDWQIEDWSVPAGAWSLTGAYIDAAKRIAEAGGGYVHGHDTDQTLIVRPYYPVAPWNWAETTPDIIMPEDVCKTEGIEWKEKTAYNAVWVTGNVGGRRDRIRRAGMSGDTQAPTIVDDLATDVIATRQRGIRVLGDTGKQAWVTVSLPVIEETGLIRPGNLIEYSEQGNTHLGLSRSLSVECQFPNVWQSIQMETHPT